MSLKDMCKASNDYYDAHGYPSDNHEHKDKRNGPNKPYNQYKGNGTQKTQAHLKQRYTVITAA